MKIFYAFFVLFQLLLALLRRDRNQVAYLMYIWSSQVVNGKPISRSNDVAGASSKYRETKSEIANGEHPLLVER